MKVRPIFLVMVVVAMGYYLPACNEEVQSQNRTTPLHALAPLVGGKWVAQTGNFHQEIVYEWGLDKTIIKVKVYSVINPETGEFGLRREGIRAYHSRVNKILMWDFDIYGDILEGECIVEDSAYHFEYYDFYQGELKKFRDTWQRVNEDSYTYRVSMQNDGNWNTAFVTAQFVRRP